MAKDRVELAACPRDVGVFALGTGVVLNLMFPLKLSGNVAENFRGPVLNLPVVGEIDILPTLAGIGLIGAGFALAGAGRRELKRNKTSVSPGDKIERLVTTGIFSKVRNPMYLAMELILFGAGLVQDSWWHIFCGVGLFLYLDKTVIPAEENVLSHLFGDSFRDYCSQVPRWGLKF